MLEPFDRKLLLESLRPPLGYGLDYAVGTTFSLDLLALLTAPLAFALFDAQDEEGRTVADPLALLAALRRYADRIAVFCQAGQITVPKNDQLLYGYLEESVFAVNAPNPAGLFHPKVWLLRFVPGSDSDEAERPVVYRLLCLTRNLTFDRSWDTMLSLEGQLVERNNAYSTNHPLGDFIAALPGMAVRDVPEMVRERVTQLEREVRRVRFEMPDGLSLRAFWPMGIGRGRRLQLPMQPRRLMAISPFISDGFLREVGGKGTGHVLISRAEELDAVSPSALAPFKDEIYVLSPNAQEEPTDTAAETAADGSPVTQMNGGAAPISPAADEELPVQGLHAKLFLVEEGWDVRIWTGSANATRAAFNQNVEFLVELKGKRSQFGIDTLLKEQQGRTSFGRLLQRYTPPAEPLEGDALGKRLDELLETARRALGRTAFTAQVSDGPEPQTFCLTLSASGEVGLPASVMTRCWPITLREDAAQRPGDAEGRTLRTEFAPVSFEALTSFFAFSVTATAEGENRTSRFVLSVPLSGAPADRRDRLLRALLRDKRQVMRFLLFLLAEDNVELTNVPIPQGTEQRDGRGAASSGLGGGFPLFELLMRTLDRQPEKLDQIARLVEDLSASDGGKDLLPDGFEDIWRPIWAAREGVSR